MKRTLGRYFPGAILLALVSILSPTNAYASVISKASNSTAQSITSVTFKVTPETTTNGSAAGTVTLTAATPNSDTFAYFVNTGTVNVKAFSWTITHSVGTGTFTLDACPVNTTYSLPTCSDGSTPITLATSGTGPALTVGQWRPIHILIKTKTDAFTVASTVSGSQIRTGTNTVG